MPPKKIDQQSSPYIPFYILPLFNSNNLTQSQSIIRSKPINIKKCIDKQKIIQLLKDKGLEKFINLDGSIQNDGRKFICQNFSLVLSQVINQINKPVDNKKDAKKDTKKDSKKEEILPDDKQPTIQLNINKKCNDFHLYFDFPSNADELKLAISNGMKIDVIVIINQKVKKGSKLPDFNLLGKNLEANQLLQTLNATKINEQFLSKKISNQIDKIQANKKILNFIKSLKSNNPQFSNILIKQINYEKDLSHPEKDEMNFINDFFSKLAQVTLDKEIYEKWVKQQVKTTPMIEPLRRVIKKQVQVQAQNQKGKKDANKQPQFQTVQQVIEQKYQSKAQNIKSSLQTYKRLIVHKKPAVGSCVVHQTILNCIQAIYPSQWPLIGTQNKQLNLQNKPISSYSSLQHLKKNLRQIKSYSPNDRCFNLISQTKQILMDVSMQDYFTYHQVDKDIIMVQYVIDRFQNFLTHQQPKIHWDFKDRTYREKLTKHQVLTLVQHQIMKDPKVYQATLTKDNIKLLCLAKINPPGRVLYSNDIYDLKAVPNFQYWSKHIRGSDKTNQNQFFDYRFQDVGNLSIKRQKLMPNDNVIICDQTVTIGNSTFKVNYFQKDHFTYGLKKLPKQNCSFWLSNSKINIHLQVFEQQHDFKKSTIIKQQVKQQGSNETKIVQKTMDTIQKQKRVETWFRTQKYILGNNPYPIIIWTNKNTHNRLEQVRRQFGPKGQITSYLKDGTVKIYYLNGNVSSFRNNKWQRIVSNKLIIAGEQPKQLQVQQYMQVDKLIRIRSDNTIFISYQNGNTLTVFQDNTKVLYTSSSKSYQILNNKYCTQLIIRLFMPRSKDFNLIGHGSAFSYLGFNNLFQRSYDGFLYQVWTNQFSSHLYNEKYQHQHQIFQEEIRLLYLRDGTLIKIYDNGKIDFVQGNMVNTQQTLRKQWNQVFTTQDNHQQGLYYVDLTKGSIKTKDAQSNIFKVNVQDQNQINIAVSFKIDDTQQAKNEFGTGFHVPQQNYFLPAPSNSIPARLFSFDIQNNEYYEYLSQVQIKQIQSPQQKYNMEQSYIKQKLIRQYTKQQKQKDKLNLSDRCITFSKCPVNSQFQLPNVLVPKQTKLNMKVQDQPVVFRLLEKIQWDKNFQNIKRLEQKILAQRQKRQTQITNLAN